MAASGRATPWDVGARVRAERRRWLVTGGAGFIGSHLVEALLRAGQDVVVLDNLSTGRRENFEAAVAAAGARATLMVGDITDLAACRSATVGVDLVLHEAALGSVPRSVSDPLATHRANLDGFVNVLVAARDAGVRRLVYASSSSVYGDDARLPKRERRVGAPLSPYAATKRAGEVYAQAFARAYGMELVGLRYFNVFGARQDPAGPYAAVIPRWIAALAQGKACVVFGDGSNRRDFCHVDNVVQANLRAALTRATRAVGGTFNVAVGQATTLLELFALIRGEVARIHPRAASAEPVFEPPRKGDIKDSLADISAAKARLGYAPTRALADGLAVTVPAYLEASNP